VLTIIFLPSINPPPPDPQNGEGEERKDGGLKKKTLKHKDSYKHETSRLSLKKTKPPKEEKNQQQEEKTRYLPTHSKEEGTPLLCLIPDLAGMSRYKKGLSKRGYDENRKKNTRWDTDICKKKAPSRKGS